MSDFDDPSVRRRRFRRGRTEQAPARAVTARPPAAVADPRWDDVGDDEELWDDQPVPRRTRARTTGEMFTRRPMTPPAAEDELWSPRSDQGREKGIPIPYHQEVDAWLDSDADTFDAASQRSAGRWADPSYVPSNRGSTWDDQNEPVREPDPDPVAPEIPLTETSLTETPLTETPLTETPLTETPLTETPLTETPLTDDPAWTEAPEVAAEWSAPPPEPAAPAELLDLAQELPQAHLGPEDTPADVADPELQAEEVALAAEPPGEDDLGWDTPPPRRMDFDVYLDDADPVVTDTEPDIGETEAEAEADGWDAPPVTDEDFATDDAPDETEVATYISPHIPDAPSTAADRTPESSEGSVLIPAAAWVGTVSTVGYGLATVAAASQLIALAHGLATGTASKGFDLLHRLGAAFAAIGPWHGLMLVFAVVLVSLPALLGDPDADQYDGTAATAIGVSIASAVVGIVGAVLAFRFSLRVDELASGDSTTTSSLRHLVPLVATAGTALIAFFAGLVVLRARTES